MVPGSGHVARSNTPLWFKGGKGQRLLQAELSESETGRARSPDEDDSGPIPAA